MPAAAGLAARHAAIREEAARLLDIPFWGQWRPYAEDGTHEGAGRWDVLALCGGGRRNQGALRHCPVTASVLAGVPDLRQALFSSLSPHTRIKPHRGAPGILRVHLGLFAEPGQSGWRVAGEVRPCVEGEVVIFADGCEHEAWNDGDNHRITLLFDTPAPDLSAEERRAVLAAYDAQMAAGRGSLG